VNANPTLSYWQHTVTGQTTEQPPLRESIEADVVIVGGGLTGLLSAYRLSAQAAHLRIVLLEANGVGSGASARSAGMILPRPHAALADRYGESAVQASFDELRHACDDIASIAASEGFDCEFERTSFLSTALAAAHLPRLQAMERTYAKYGLPCELHDADRTRAMVNGHGFLGSLQQHGMATINPAKLVAGLKRALIARGVTIYENTPVTQVVEGDTLAIWTPHGDVRSSWMILALNAFSASAGTSIAKLPAPLVQKSFALVTEPVPDHVFDSLGWSGRQCVSDMRNIGIYARRINQRILVGGRLRFARGHHAPSDAQQLFARLRKELAQRMPSLTTVPTEHAWFGPIALSPDDVPIIGRTGRTQRILYAHGYSGLGLALSTVSSRVLADMVSGDVQRWEDTIYLRSGRGPEWKSSFWRALQQYWRYARNGRQDIREANATH